MKSLFAVVLPIYAFDQAAKWWIVKNFALLEQRTVIPDYFDLCYFTNTGAAFSIGSGNNFFFICLSVVVGAALLFFYARRAFPDALSRWGCALLLAGLLGNLTDRIIHGHVIDFLLVDLHIKYANPWPAFNVADSAICIAAGLFILSSFRSEKPAPPSGSRPADPAAT